MAHPPRPDPVVDGTVSASITRVPTVLRSMLAPTLAALDLPNSRRRALGCFLRHLALGERVAQRSAARQARLTPDIHAARFMRSQARHQALHGLPTHH